MMPTNLVIVPAFSLMGGSVTATPIDVCETCGGLFVRAGVMLPYSAQHTH